MTMHLVRGMSSLNGKKRKKKPLTQNQIAKLEVEWRVHNKRMRKINCHSAQFDTLDDYIKYIRGEYKPKKEFKEYVPKEPYVRHTESHPSLKTSDVIPGACAKKESPQYSGDYIIGIGTMHKSNLVPVGRGSDPKDLANMRRN